MIDGGTDNAHREEQLHHVKNLRRLYAESLRLHFEAFLLFNGVPEDIAAGTKLSLLDTIRLGIYAGRECDWDGTQRCGGVRPPDLSETR